MIKVKTIVIGNSLENLNHIVYSTKSKKAIIFDPYDFELINQNINDLNLTPIAIMNTHYHPDHMRHNRVTSDSLSIPVLDNSLENEKVFLDETSYVKATFTPGHVADHYIFEIYESRDKCIGVITGDTLFNCGIGNCRLGGNVETLFETTTNIVKKLPSDAIIYPSHDYFLNNLEFSKTVETKNHITLEFINKKELAIESNELIFTKIADELDINPFLRLEHLDIFNGNNKETFIKLRSLRDSW